MLFQTKLYKVVQSCPPIAANVMLDIYVIPVVVLCCSAYVLGSVEAF